MTITNEQLELLTRYKVFDRLHEEMEKYKDKYKTLFVDLMLPDYKFYLKKPNVQLYTFFILVQILQKKILIEMKYDAITDRLYEYNITK